MIMLMVAFAPFVSDAAGLVKCKDPNGICTFGDIMPTISGIINWVIIIAVSISAIMFAYAGFLYMTAQGDLGQMKKGRDIFKNVVIGFVIMLSAWLIVTLVLNTLINEGNIPIIRRFFPA